MNRILIVILAGGLGALLIGMWLYLNLRQPITKIILREPTVQAPSPMTSKNFALHPAPRPVPELAFNNGDGKQTTLADFRGKIVLLNIWATWCGPCRREMPTLDRLQAMLGGANFEVVALSIDRAGPDAVRRFYREIFIKNLGLYINSTGKITGTLGIVGIPTTLLINRAGQEIGRLVGPADWDTPDMVTFLKGNERPLASHPQNAIHP